LGSNPFEKTQVCVYEVYVPQPPAERTLSAGTATRSQIWL